MSSTSLITAAPVTGLFKKYQTLVEQTETIRVRGHVENVYSLMIECIGPITKIGDVCQIEVPGRETILAEVINIKGSKVTMMLLGDGEGIVPGTLVYSYGKSMEIMAGDELLGRVLDSTGTPLDTGSLNFFNTKISVFNKPPSVLTRKRITEKFTTGVKAIDSLLTMGKGQRMGIFSGSGVGKSTLLGMIARNTNAEINVICLVGERGREVREFIERDLGPEGMKRSVLIVSTSDEPPMARVRCVYTATAIAEYFRDQGKDVLLMVDSLTRMAMAQREIGASAGEPQVLRGYSPSVFKLLATVLERAATSEKGTITGIYNVLVEGSDMDEPIADAVRGILDGHIVLTRELAERGHYPAIDVTRSISRLMNELVEPAQREAARRLVEIIAAYNEAADLVRIGAYQMGSDPLVDEALRNMNKYNEFLRQKIEEKFDPAQAVELLLSLTGIKSNLTGDLLSGKKFFNDEDEKN